MKIAAVLVMGALCSSPTLVDIVTTDFGGTLGDYQAKVDAVRREGRQVQILGTCNSSCRLYLNLPPENLCLSRHAWIGSHKDNYANHDVIEYVRGSYYIERGYRECRI